MNIRYLGILLVVGLAFADEPPSWHPFTVTSENGKSQASVAPVTDTTYQLKVERMGRKNLLNGTQVWKTKWKRTYEYDGYTGGLVTNSGRYFVYVDEWYSEEKGIVFVYSCKKNILKYKGDVFVKDKAILEKGASHFLWLSREKRPKIKYDHGQEILVITTLDEKEHEVVLGK